MNIYDMKQIRCIKCEKFIGEVDFDAEIIRPLCGRCANPIPEIINVNLQNTIKKIKIPIA